MVSQLTNRTCTRCGRIRPLTEFDQRFVGKKCNVTCAKCRGVNDESHKWQAVWARQREKYRQWQQELEGQGREDRKHDREKREQSYEEQSRLHEVRRQENEKQRQLRQAQEDAWRDRMFGLGFDDIEQSAIHRIHSDIDHSKASWIAIVQQFRALEPSVCRSTPKRRYVSRAEKHRIFALQDGLCYYCKKPIVVSNETATVCCLCGACHRDRNEVGYTTKHPARVHCSKGQIEHKIPRSRGGSDETENLC